LFLLFVLNTFHYNKKIQFVSEKRMIKRLAFTVFAAQALPRVAALAKSTPVKTFSSSALSMSAFDDLGKTSLVQIENGGLKGTDPILAESLWNDVPVLVYAVRRPG